MIQYLEIFFNFFCLTIKFYIFTYLFHPLYIKCNVQTKIKKGKKKKIIYKPKCILAFVYFALLFLLFKLFTFEIFILFFIGLFFSMILCYDFFIPNFNDNFDYYNKLFIVILFWKIFHTIFTIIYVCTNPINIFFNPWFYFN